MQFLRWRLAVAGLCVALLSTGCSGEPADALQQPYELLDGRELVLRLQDEEERPRAFFELWRRDREAKDKGFENFTETHRDPWVVVCPQGGKQQPIMIVLYGFLSRLSESLPLGSYLIPNPEELFPGELPPGPTMPIEKPGIEAFASDGKRIHPFGGNNVLDGVLRDINGDGIVERVEVTRYGVDGIENVDVLEIVAVKRDAELLLTVLLNWGESDWSHRLKDTDGDGIAELELGPLTDEGLKARVVFRWDDEKRRYVSSAGDIGEHFRVLDGSKTWKALNGLKGTLPLFPPDPDAVVESATRATSAAVPNQPSAEGPKPLHEGLSGQELPASLADLSNEEIVRYMGEGKQASDPELEQGPNRVPEDFWKSDSKTAALKLVDANRSEEHRKQYRLAVDDRDQARPPERFTVEFSDSSSRCYNAVDGHYFLRVDPENSYLSYARSWAGGVVFYNVVHDQPAFDLRDCPVPYEVAKQLGEVIWWLDRVRTSKRGERDDGYGSFSRSTADGHGALVLRGPEGEPLIEREGTLWHGTLSRRWSGGYLQECAVNFGAFILEDLLPRQLGDAWSKFEPVHSQTITERIESDPQYTELERERIADLAQRYLNRFSPARTRVSFAILAEATRVAGEFALEAAMPQLKKVRETYEDLKTPAIPYAVLSDERSRIVEQLKLGPPNRKNLEKRRDELDLEIDAWYKAYSGGSPLFLRDAADRALEQIRLAANPEELFKLATSKAENGQWAMQRLEKVDRKRYVDALEMWLDGDNGNAKRQIFKEILRVDPERARSIAMKVPINTIDPLSLSAFEVLRDANLIADEAAWIQAMIRVLHETKSGWEERSRAIELLVPLEDPLRYPGDEIDQALLRVLEPNQADDTINFSLSRACGALARRGRTKYFDRIAEVFRQGDDPYIEHELLGALAQMAQVDPERAGSRVQELLAPHLEVSNLNTPEVLWAVWAADLRELTTAVERLATSGPDESEDLRANRYGGEASRVDGRFHLARQIAGVWREPEPATRLRLVIALAWNERRAFAEHSNPERWNRVRAELASGGRQMTLAQRERVLEFVNWLYKSGAESGASKEVNKRFVVSVREALASGTE